MLIVLGLEPTGMDTLVVTTPEIPAGVDVASLPTTPVGEDPHVAMIDGHPRLAALWERMVAALDEQTWIPPVVLDACRRRVAELHGVRWALDAPTPVTGAADPDVVAACVAVTEMFVVDVHAVTDEMAAEVTRRVGPEGLTTLAAALAIWEGFYRLASTWGWAPATAESP
ncbi:MAG: hypothetical protein RIE08_09265 [Acidimicrobiales bacterium]